MAADDPIALLSDDMLPGTPGDTKRIIITGSRNWTDHSVIERALERATSDTPDGKIVIVHGGARGADSIADEIAAGWGLRIEVFKADWDRYGKAAGFIRNKAMAVAGGDICLAFPLGESRGTRMMMDLAKKHHIPLEVYEG